MSLTVPDFSAARLLVAGDVMLDRYWFGPAERISPEAPVPVIKVSGREDRAGGAANVAVNVAALGAAATLLGVTGDDEPANRLETLLAERDIDCALLRHPELPTTTKLRVLSRNQQLIRLDEEEVTTLAAQALASRFSQLLAGQGAVILSDYAKGALAECGALIEAAVAAGVPVLVDPKGADFSRYRGATLLTPNLKEFETVVGDCPSLDELTSRGARLCAELALDALLITRSEKGMSLIRRGAEPLHLPAEAREVYDVTGAGDTVIAALAVALAAGESLAGAATLANVAAGLVVRKLGVATVTRAEIRLALHQRGIGGRGMLTQDRLISNVRESQERGERIVMTNGCFDLLHAGHVAYLEDAKAMGDRLVVAVNDDASVQRLKGAGRPITPLADRMAVLAGLAAVDWVVAFESDTPAELIDAVLPDVLVKGGDYAPDEIAGAGAVRANGGEVAVLPFRPGRSTSTIIKSIRGR